MAYRDTGRSGKGEMGRKVKVKGCLVVIREKEVEEKGVDKQRGDEGGKRNNNKRHVMERRNTKEGKRWSKGD